MSATDVGDMVVTSGNTFKNNLGHERTYNSIFTNLYTTLNGNGYSISYDQVKDVPTGGLGITFNFIGTWFNVIFDIDISSVGNLVGPLLMCNIAAEDGVAASISNCYFDVDISNSITGGARLFYNHYEGVVSNCIFDVSIPGDTFYFASHSNDDKTSIFENNVFVSTGNIGDLTCQLYYDKVVANLYSSYADLLSGANGKKYTSTTGTWNVPATSSTTTEICYTSWDNVWAFDATAGTVKLLGTTVATVPAAE
jgi:hypothetical protein